MNKTPPGLAATSAPFLSSGAFVQGDAGIGAGPSRIDIDCADADSCDRTGIGFKRCGGMRFANPLAVEAVCFDRGKARAAATDVES